MDDISDVCCWGWRRRFFHEKNLFPRVWKEKLDIVAEEGVLPRAPAKERWKGSSGFRWKKVQQVLPRDPAEELCLSRIPRKNYVFRRSRGTLFRRQHFVVAEEPAEPSSAGYLSFSRKNMRNFFRGPCFAVFCFFSWKFCLNHQFIDINNYFIYLFAITKCIWYLTYTSSLILMHHLLYFAFIWLGCLNWIIICCHWVRMSKWLYIVHKLCGLVRILFPWWMRGLRKKKTR